VFPNINNISRVLILSGLLMSLIGKSVFGIEWLDIVGYSIILIGLVLAKNDIIEGNEDYGKYIYYTLLVLFLFIVFGKWFGF
jgi:hypothetical protein